MDEINILEGTFTDKMHQFVDGDGQVGPSLNRARLRYQERHFGYWRRAENEESTLPWPTVSGQPDHDFMEALRELESDILMGKVPGAGCMNFMGRTVSRLTGERLGAKEFYVHDDSAMLRYAWPEDYNTHYLAAGVQPELDFVDLVTRMKPPPESDMVPQM